MPRSIPDKFGRYTIEEELGRGTMGVVYRAFDPVLGRAIALKTIHLVHVLSKRRRAAFEQRFLTEARVAAQLQHPGIVVVHDLGRDNESGDLFIALELLVGETLDDWIEGDRRPNWREALRIVARVAEALHHAHVRGIVHRDVKPANIMVLEHGQPKIMDFGIAKIEAGQLTTPGELFGTPLYMSPEQALGRAAGPRSDLFSLGSVAYALLTGRVPFRAPDVPAILARVAHLDPGLPSELVSGLPADVDYLVARTMAKDPERRHANGQALAEDIDDVCAGRPPRHRGDWQMPERGGATVVSREALASLPLNRESVGDPPSRRHRPSARLRIFLWLCLAIALLVLAFERDPRLTNLRRTLAEQAEAYRARTQRSAPAVGPSLTPVAMSMPDSAETQTQMPMESPAETPPASVSPLAFATATPTPTSTPEPTPEPTPTPTPSVSPSPTPTPPRMPVQPRGTPVVSRRPLSSPSASALLRLDVEVPRRGGELRVWIDGRPMLTTQIDGHAASPAFNVTPGLHEIRIRLRAGTSVGTASARGTFSARHTRRLVVRLSKGRLSLRWK